MTRTNLHHKLCGLDRKINQMLMDSANIEKQLRQVSDPYVLARNAAIRLCDEEGNLLFNPQNIDDLEQLNGLGQSLLSLLNQEDGKKKS